MFNVNDYFSIGTLLFALGALGFTAYQIYLSRREMQRQAYLTLESLEHDSGYQEGIRYLDIFKLYQDYPSFKESVDPEIQSKIHAAISYLNFVAHLVDDGYLHTKRAWHLYFHAYRYCNANVPKWWLEGIRQFIDKNGQENNNQIFRTYEIMAQAIDDTFKQREKQEQVWREKLAKRLQRRIKRIHLN